MTDEQTKYLETFPGWLRNLGEDAEALADLLGEDGLPTVAQEHVCGGLNDLFKKKFDYENTVTVKRSTASGLKIETVGKQVVNDKKTSLGGSVKLSYKEKGLGEFEASNNHAGNLTGKAKFTNLADGVVATLEYGPLFR